MELNRESVEILAISNTRKHDLIRVMIQERGSTCLLIVTELDLAWVCCWGSMGIPLSEVISSNDVKYLADGLLQGTKYTKAEYKRMLSRASVIIEALKKEKLIRELEADEVLWDRKMEDMRDD